MLALVVRASAVWCAASRLRSAQSDDDDGARSQFGTKDYWDEMYAGRGDFSSEEYSWYFGWDKIRPIWEAHVPDKASRVLLPCWRSNCRHRRKSCRIASSAMP